jgi:hypothetical protein
MSRLQREMARLQETGHLLGGTSAPITSFPAMNLYAGDEGVILTAELPGIEADDLEISVLGETLTLSGSRNMGDAEEGVKYHRRERSQGDLPGLLNCLSPLTASMLRRNSATVFCMLCCPALKKRSREKLRLAPRVKSLTFL